jgi:VanZ family protein
VSEPQPRRNPRPRPPLAELQSRLRPPQAWDWLRDWWPAIGWAALIFSMSTDAFSAAHTGRVLQPLLHWLFPSLTGKQFDTVHFLIRKSAHFSEYFVFCLLLYRAVRGRRKGWHWSWGLAALFCAAGYSILDEIHQAFVASRTASPYDSLLDSAGAFAAFAVLWAWFRSRPSACGAEIAVSQAPSA